MITKEQFISLISDHKNWLDNMEKVADVFDASIWEADWVEYTSVLFDNTLQFVLNEHGIEDVQWWLFEKAGNPDMKMWDEEGNEIPTETLDDLWEIVKDSII